MYSIDDIQRINEELGSYHYWNRILENVTRFELHAFDDSEDERPFEIDRSHTAELMEFARAQRLKHADCLRNVYGVDVNIPRSISRPGKGVLK